MTDKEFDIKLRSMLEGVWEGISASLDKAAAKKKRPVPVFWWRTLGATAAAAAVALGIILWPSPKGNFKEVDPGTSGPVAVVTSPEVTPEVSPATDPVEVPSSVLSVAAVRHHRQMAGEPAATPAATSEQVVPEAVQTETIDAGPATAASTTPVSDQSVTAVDAAVEAVAAAASGTPVPDQAEAVGAAGAVGTDNAPSGSKGQPSVNFPEFTGIPATPTARQSARRTDFTVGGNAFAASSRTVAAAGNLQHAASRMAMPKLRSPRSTGISASGETSRYGLPVTVSAGARFYVTKRFSLGTGVGYTFLTRTFPGTYNEVGLDEETGNQVLIRSVSSDNIRNDQHYIGVPVNAYYDFVQHPRVHAYVHAGGEVEKNVRSHYRVPAGNEIIAYNEKVKGVQWSVGGGVGVEVRLGKYVGLYVDPGVRYYFKGSQPASIRTVQPLMFGFDAGLRFNLDRQN